MSCGVSSDQLWAWIHGEDDAEAAVGAHVQSCAACRGRVADMRALVDDLSGIGREPPGDPARRLPDRIGNYRILRKLGEGGMGVVFEAEQPAPARRVALKVVRGSEYLDSQRVRLFQREIQTLARLTHPGIAAIYDAGCTAEGEHFFAMELVDGVPLSRYVTGRGADAPPMLTLEERLRLFLTVCGAINYAHQRGVIHRDLKPSNILVTANGDPKILDFGLARITEADVQVTFVSEPGALAGTLPYMSPEQARGDTDDIDVRTDVYALGVILYELLTGVLPNAVLDVPLHEAVRRICEQAPPSPRALDPTIPLDAAIVAQKALEKESERRYPTAAALAEDVERYLTDRPILARPPSRVYQARRLAQRHKLAFGLLTLIFLLAIGSAITFAIMTVRIADQRDAISRERDIARQINFVLEDMLRDADPWAFGDANRTIRQALDEAAGRLDDKPMRDALVEASLRNTLANSYMAMSDYDAAERHFRISLDHRRTLLGDTHLDVAQTENDLGELYLLQGRTADAAPLLDHALEVRKAQLPPFHASIAVSENNLGLWYKRARDGERAERHLRAALDIRSSIAARVPSDPTAASEQDLRAINDYAQTLNNLAALLRTATRNATEDRARVSADLREAELLYLRALELRSRYLPENHPDVAKMHNNYAKLLQDLANEPSVSLETRADLRQRSIENLNIALRVLRAGFAQDPDHAFICQTLHNLASVQHDAGIRSAAEANATEALALRRSRFGADSAQVAATAALLDEIRGQVLP